MQKKMRRLVALACAGVLATVLLAGCAQQGSAENDAQAQNRSYMSTVNQTVDDLSTRLDSFEEAVVRGDVVTMRTQLDNAMRALDDLAAIEAPEPLVDVQAGYVEGCEALKGALNAYVELYTEIDSATEAHPFDYSTFAERIKGIQDMYNDGIAKLEAADKKASEL